MTNLELFFSLSSIIKHIPKNFHFRTVKLDDFLIFLCVWMPGELSTSGSNLKEHNMLIKPWPGYRIICKTQTSQFNKYLGEGGGGEGGMLFDYRRLFLWVSALVVLIDRPGLFR